MQQELFALVHNGDNIQTSYMYSTPLSLGAVYTNSLCMLTPTAGTATCSVGFSCTFGAHGVMMVISR